MKSVQKNSADLFAIALIAVGLGIFNLVISRYIDGTLCLIVGIVIGVLWKIKRTKQSTHRKKRPAPINK